MIKLSEIQLTELLSEIKSCTLCCGKIPSPRPIVRASINAKILIIGQAPSAKVHASGIPWMDASGARLRQWMGIDQDNFYDESQVAIVPMGFCYPGKGKSGDLPPRAECASVWHKQLTPLLTSVRCTLLVGAYAQNYYGESRSSTLTTRVRQWQEYAPTTFMLPHPSPRNVAWFTRNPWFDHEVVPALQQQVSRLLSESAISPGS